ncbi:MAG: hypothetical protein AABX05_04010 [Nanoarchaeota archaeon]
MPKIEPKEIFLDQPHPSFSDLELKLVQNYHFSYRKDAAQLKAKAKTTAVKNSFDYYLFVDEIKDPEKSRPGQVGSIHYYNRKKNNQYIN